MPPKSGGIFGILTKDLPRSYLQGGVGSAGGLWFRAKLASECAAPRVATLLIGAERVRQRALGR